MLMFDFIGVFEIGFWIVLWIALSTIYCWPIYGVDNVLGDKKRLAKGILVIAILSAEFVFILAVILQYIDKPNTYYIEKSKRKDCYDCKYKCEVK